MRAFEGLKRQFDRRPSQPQVANGPSSPKGDAANKISDFATAKTTVIGMHPTFNAQKALAQLQPKKAQAPKTKQEWFNQLLSTEEEYCDLMKIFNEEYVKPIREDSKAPKSIYFSKQEYQRILVFLTNVEALLTLNSRFRDDLKTKRADKVVEVLAQYAPLFQMYGQYASDFAVAESTIAQQAESNEKFASFLNTKLKDTGRSIDELLRIPLDRIEQYSESASKLCDLYPEDRSLFQASDELSKTAEYVEAQGEATRRLDRLKQLSKIWTGTNLIGGAVSRLFIMEGDLEKYTRKHVVKCRFLLFNDVLMYGVPVSGVGGGDKVRFKRSLPLVSMVVEDAQTTSSPRLKRESKASLGLNTVDEDDDEDEENGHIGESSTSGGDDDASNAFFILTPLKSFKVVAESPEIKSLWLSEMRFYIEQAKRGSESKEVSASELRPVWVPDVQSKACMRCHKAFTMVRRRHHCRRCGVLVCQPCSRTRINCTLPAGPNRTKEVRVRVCDECAKKPPSVRYSLTKGDVAELSKGVLVGGSAEDYSSDDEKGGSSRRLSVSSSNGGEAVMFDEASASTQPGLSCVVIQARTEAELGNTDELVLALDDEVAVEEITAGWAVGTNLRTSKYGWAPANFMQMKDTRAELPENYDGQPPPSSVPVGLRRKASSSSFSDQVPASPRNSSSGAGGRRASIDISSLDGNGTLDGKPQHRRNRSSIGGEEEAGRSHRRSSSNNLLEDRRGSGAVPGGASIWSSPPSQLLTFTDKRSLIFNEIVVTERTYLNSLNVLLTVFVRPLLNDSKSGKPQFGGGVLSVMNEAGDGAAMSVFMSRLEHILTLNSKLAVDLEARLAQWTSAPEELGGTAPECTCGDVFLNYAPLFNMYDEYSSSYEFATKTLVDREKSDSKLAKFLQDQTAAHAGLMKQQTILSLLITPIQRVPRYLLLLKEMLKNTPEKHPDRRLVEQAIATISQVALHINEHIRERENMVALREIDREFEGKEQLTDNPSRVFLLRGDLVKRSRKTDSTYHLWLFSDVLLYQKKAKGLASKPPKRIEVRTLTVIDLPDDTGGSNGSAPATPPTGTSASALSGEAELPFAFDLRSQAKSFRVFASDAADKEKWVRALQDAIEQATGGRVLSAKDAAPVWEQDTRECTVCEAHFTFLFRRHHCRACGKCVCDKCSRNRMFLKNVDDSKEVRVCLPCFESLSGPSNSVVKRSALTSVLTTASRKGGSSSSLNTLSGLTPSGSGSPASPSSAKLASSLVGFGGSKRTQTEAAVQSPRTTAVVVDHRQITMMSQEMAERRRQRGEQHASERDSSADSPVSSPLLSQRSPGNSASPMAKSLSSIRQQQLSDSPSKKAPALKSLSASRLEDELRATMRPSVPPVNTKAFSSSSIPIVTSSATGSNNKKKATPDETDSTSPERKAMTAVLQDISRYEVPIQAPKPVHMHEVPKPLPVARIASPAQLSPVSSPKITPFSATPPGFASATNTSPISAATPSTLSSATPTSTTTPGSATGAASPLTSASTGKPTPPNRRPSSVSTTKATTNSASPSNQGGKTPSSDAAKRPVPPPKNSQQVSSTKSPALSAAPTRTPQQDSSRSLSANKSSSSASAPVRPTSIGSGASPASGNLKPTPPPIPKRRPSSNRLSRNDSNPNAVHMLRRSSSSTSHGDNLSQSEFDIL